MILRKAWFDKNKGEVFLIQCIPMFPNKVSVTVSHAHGIFLIFLGKLGDFHPDILIEANLTNKKVCMYNLQET